MYTYILTEVIELAIKSEYGEILTSLIKSKGMSQSYFYQHLKIAKPYFYDIVSGKVKPPPADTQIKIVKFLNLDKKQMISLFDVAAAERNELPLDVMLYLKKLENLDEIRFNIDYSEILGGNV